jgi:hypothetical protein
MLQRGEPSRCIDRHASQEVRLILLCKDASSQFSTTADIDFLKDRFEMILNGVR